MLGGDFDGLLRSLMNSYRFDPKFCGDRKAFPILCISRKDEAFSINRQAYKRWLSRLGVEALTIEQFYRLSLQFQGSNAPLTEGLLASSTPLRTA